MRVKLKDKSYKVIRSRAIGEDRWADVDHPDKTKPHKRKIRISDKLAKSNRLTKKQLEILIHECLHVLFWDVDEKVIESAGKDLARILHRLGARVDLTKLPDR